MNNTKLKVERIEVHVATSLWKPRYHSNNMSHKTNVVDKNVVPEYTAVKNTELFSMNRHTSNIQFKLSVPLTNSQPLRYMFRIVHHITK